ncbi:hypothetical protein, partial [Porphyromonas sp.]|uniref:hypothetical protein n=1 Tax=Porphyromonas sp. TaxID=1924944 RepID=UPI0026DBC04F
LLLQSDCKGTKIFYSHNREPKKKIKPKYNFFVSLPCGHNKYIREKKSIQNKFQNTANFQTSKAQMETKSCRLKRELIKKTQIPMLNSQSAPGFGLIFLSDWADRLL